MAIPSKPSPTIFFFLLRQFVIVIVTVILVPIILSFLPVSHGQGITDSQQEPPSAYDLNTGFTSTTAVMIVILIAAFTFIVVFFVYIHRRRSTAANNEFGNFLPRMTSRRVMESVNNNGLDPAVVETFPTMVYSDVKGVKMGKLPLECAVCLCEFEDKEELTLLPKCDHAFHPQCIGMWLSSHSTCPVCRADLSAVPANPNLPTTENLSGEEGGLRQADHVAIPVEEEGEVSGRMGGMRSFSKRVLRPWRSRSARPTVGRGSVRRLENVWGEQERERFTLRLPEDVRKELMTGISNLRRSASVALVGFRGEESPRMGYSYRGGRSYKFGRSVRATAKSGRQWLFGVDTGSGSSGGKFVASVVV